MSDRFADQPWHVPGCECRHDDNGHATTTDQVCVEWTAIVREALKAHDAEVGERIAQAIAMECEQQAQKCRRVTPNDYTEGSHDAYLNAAAIARAETGAG